MTKTCPACAAALVELDRSGVRIDACPSCRGVWLDRGELDRIIERESRAIRDEDDFRREISGGGYRDRDDDRDRDRGRDDDRDRDRDRYRDDDDYGRRKRKKRESILGELFDF